MLSAGVVICLAQDANDLCVIELMPLPPDHDLASLKSRMVVLSQSRLSQAYPCSGKEAHQQVPFGTGVTLAQIARGIEELISNLSAVFLNRVPAGP